MSEDFERRYPIKRSRYTQCVGRLLAHRISQIFRELGFKTWVNHGQTNGVDLMVYYKSQLILVVEILNWSIGSLLSEKRKKCIIDNLLPYNCKKLLIYTNFENEQILKDLSDYGISLLKICYQLLPRYFYEFYLKKGQIESRAIDSRKTKEDIKSKIQYFLASSDVKINEERLVYFSLFQNRIFFFFLPLEKENIISKAQGRLECILRILHVYLYNSKDSTIKTREGEVEIHKYFREFSKNIFNCLMHMQRYESGNFTPPRKLFHGTTSIFLHKIKEEGLKPSAPGRYWSEDEYNWMERVGLTNSIHAAEYFALNAVKRFGGEPIVIEVDIGGLENQVETRKWFLPTHRTIDVFLEIYYRDVIPPHRIKNWYFLPRPSAYELVNFIIKHSKSFE